jgi:8-oxo-dGTP diphosphatase
MAASVDCIVFGYEEGQLKVLLIERGSEPFYNYWALPGDLVKPTENLDSEAKRILYELTGLTEVYMEQVRTFGAVNRHPLGRVLTIAYFALVNIEQVNAKASSWAKQLKWHPVHEVTELAFDHSEILSVALQSLKNEALNHPIGFNLLPPKFTLMDLQLLYEEILQTKLDKSNFRKKILKMNILVNSDEKQENVKHRPANLYAFNENRYQKLKTEGFTFGI